MEGGTINAGVGLCRKAARQTRAGPATRMKSFEVTLPVCAEIKIELIVQDKDTAQNSSSTMPPRGTDLTSLCISFCVIQRSVSYCSPGTQD